MKQLKLVFLLLFFVFAFTGCFQKKEVEDFAYVIALGLDKGTDDALSITFQIAVPIQIAGEGSEGGGKDSTSLVTLESDSIYNAISHANTMISKEITLSHNKLIVISEELAKEGIIDVLTAMITNPEIRPKTNILVHRGSVKEFLENLEPVLEKNPARYYDLLYASNQYTGYSLEEDLFHFYLATMSDFSTPYALLTESVKERNSSIAVPSESLNSSENIPQTANIAGIALFRGGKLVGEIQGEQILAHSILKGELKQVNINIPDVKDSHKTTVIKLLQREKPGIDATIVNGTPQIDILVKLNCELLTSGSAIDYSEGDYKQQLSNAVRKKLEKDISDYLLTITKEYAVDPIGFGERYKAKILTLNDLEENQWKNLFSKSQYHLKIELHMDITQMVSNEVE